jgi:hypothetical protein
MGIKIIDEEDSNSCVEVKKEYRELFSILLAALYQSSEGKGKERHAKENESFSEQPICEIGRRVGVGYNLGQSVKKIYEAKNYGDKTFKIKELLGAINYLAAAVILIEEEKDND